LQLHTVVYLFVWIGHVFDLSVGSQTMCPTAVIFDVMLSSYSI